MKKIMIVAIAASLALVSIAETVHDVGKALAENYTVGGTFTDDAGCVWTFGVLAKDALSTIAPLGYSYSNGSWYNGRRAASGSSALPFAIVNSSDTAQSQGGETGNIALNPGEIVVHPNNPNNAASPCVGIKCQPPCAGIYRVDAIVRDMSSGNNADGVRVIVYANGMVQQETVIAREAGVTGSVGMATTNSIALYLPADGAVTLVIDPRASYNNDSTGIFFSLTELARTEDAPVVSLNESYVGLMRTAAPTLPATVDGITIDAGSVASPTNKTVTALSTLSNIASIGCRGFGAGATGQVPFVLVNTNDAPSICDNSTLRSHTLMPHEMLIHPNRYDNSFVRFTAPADGVYRIIGLFRDLSLDSNISSFGRGIVAGISANGFCCRTSGYVSAEDATGPIVLDVRRVELSQGDAVIFSVDSNGYHGYDSTGLLAYIFADSAPCAEEVINLDIDGRQSNDPDPVTYVGAAKHASTGSFWNSMYGLNNSVSQIQLNKLKTANKTRTLVSITIDSPVGANLLFDSVANNAGMKGNDLLNDYLHVQGAQSTARLTISGLVPGGAYDLYLFSATGNRTAPKPTSVTFGGQTRWYDGQADATFLTSGNSDTLTFANLVADSNGVITGTMTGSGSNVSFVLNGVQLVGEFTFPVKRGTKIVVR